MEHLESIKVVRYTAGKESAIQKAKEKLLRNKSRFGVFYHDGYCDLWTDSSQAAKDAYEFLRDDMRGFILENTTAQDLTKATCSVAIRAKIERLDTDMIKDIGVKLNTDYRMGADHVLVILLNVLETRLDNQSFVTYCKTLEDAPAHNPVLDKKH